MKIISFLVGEDQERVLRIRSIRDEYPPPEKRPASSLLGVAGLFRPDVLIEIGAPVELPDGDSLRPGSRASTRGDVPLRGHRQSSTEPMNPYQRSTGARERAGPAVWNADGSVVLGIALSGAPASPVPLCRRQSSHNKEAVTALT